MEATAVATDLGGSSIDPDMVWGFVIVMVVSLPFYLMVHRAVREVAEPARGARDAEGRPTSALLEFLDAFPNEAVIQHGVTHPSLTIVVYEPESDEEREVVVPPRLVRRTRFDDPHSPRLPPESMRTFRERLRREARIAARRRFSKPDRTSVQLSLFWSFPVVVFLLVLWAATAGP